MRRMYDRPVEVKVWSPLEAPYACFTRPEMKVERVSYPVMTPSAARGVLEAIYWKPEFSWRIQEIVVLNPVKYVSILRNEVNSRASERAARGWEKSGGGFVASEERNRAQRNTLALRDVAYIIRAQVVLKAGVDENTAKFRDQFRRRVERGQCFAQPYLGCREFTAAFGPVEGDEEPRSGSMGIGRMLYDLDFSSDRSGNATPRFFDAELRDGVMAVPPWEEVMHAS
jgi:CRISPR-associated protein Cas5d